METETLDPVTRAAQILTCANMEVREAVANVVDGAANELVAVFYSTLIKHPEATRFLSHKLVSERLSLSMRQWLIDLYAGQGEPDVVAFTERQKLIGDVHARVRIPIHLVMQAAHLLKLEIFQRLRNSALARDDLWTAVVYTNRIMDLALELMSQAFVRSTASRAQTDEAYRLFSLGQDVTLDRESQRAALLEWSQGILFSICGPERDVSLPPLSTSDFGLWLLHRAGVMFQGSNSLANIEGAMRLVDSEILPRIREAKATNSDRLPVLLEQFQTAMAEIKFLLNDMFQSVAAIENGRDPLTKALNRRFLPSILSREITIASKNNKPFSIIMLDVDHFKQVNDTWGHPAGDAVLSQVADVILDTCRLSDFVFRYGGEEFLVALVETDTDGAFQVAERIRTQIELREFVAPDKSILPITASIGIATYDGHPDYSHLIQSADQALYRAKRDGRNCSMVAERVVLERVG